MLQSLLRVSDPQRFKQVDSLLTMSRRHQQQWKQTKGYVDWRLVRGQVNPVEPDSADG